MRSSIERALVLAGALALTACGDRDGDGPGIDAAVDAPVPGEGLVFRLSYDSDVPDSIFVQSGTEFGGQAWLTVRPQGGADLAILDDCGQCNCDSCDPCAVCGAGLPEVTEIPRGQHLDWAWDAMTFRNDRCATGGLSCERAEPIAPGTYVARFCWSFTSDGVGPGHHIGPVTCGEETFAYPPATTEPIEHRFCACG